MVSILAHEWQKALTLALGVLFPIFIIPTIYIVIDRGHAITSHPVSQRNINMNIDKTNGTLLLVHIHYSCVGQASKQLAHLHHSLKRT